MGTWLCIDGNSILNRAFYGIRLLTTRDGFPTNALYGFVNIVSRQLEELRPDCAAVAYDLPAPTFRHKLYPGYKAGRHPTPEELQRQMPVSREFARMLGLRILEREGYEADDILGTVAAMGEREPDTTVYLLTGDRDALQLISPRVRVLLAGNRETAEMDEDAFLAKYGVPADRFVEVKALMGDASDRIPGVAGVGEKTALSLIARFGSVDALYGRLDAPDLSPTVRRKLEEGRERAYLSLDLSRIRRDVPLGAAAQDLRARPMDRAEARRLFTRYEFSAFLKRFDLLGGDPEPGAPVEVEEAPARTAEVSSLPSLPAGRYAVSYADRVLTLCDGGRPIRCAVAGEADRPAVEAFLSDPSRSFTAYDCKGLYRELDRDGIRFRSCDFDVMLAAYVLRSDMSDFSLDRICLSYAGAAPRTEDERAAAVLRLREPLERALAETGQTAVFREIEMPLAAVLCDMEVCGFRIDRASMRRYGEALDAAAAETETRVYTLAGRPFNINSPKQLGEILFEVLGLPAGKKTKSGYSTGAAVLDRLRGLHPIVGDILEYRRLTKLKSTYVDGLLKLADDDGIVRTTFKQTGTATGRLSSAEPNLQNIPIRTELGREMRKFFLPSSPDRALIDADYSQIELRILADVADDAAMREAFLAGCDIHADTASRMFHVPIEAVTPELRSRAKAINFGIMYGMGDYSLSQDLRIPRAEARRYIEDYRNSYPDISRYLEEIVRTAAAQGYVTTKAGRRRYIPELSESNRTRRSFGERVAMNSPIQGTAADIIKTAMIRVHRRLADSGLDARMILQVHDELILDASRESADEALTILREEMERAASLTVPLRVEARVGENWFLAH